MLVDHQHNCPGQHEIVCKKISCGGESGFSCDNAVYVGGKWIKLDARGNKPGVHTRFSTEEPSLAFECRPEYEEHFWKGIYAEPHLATMTVLEESRCLQDVIDKLPDEIDATPDINGQRNEIWRNCQRVKALLSEQSRERFLTDS